MDQLARQFIHDHKNPIVKVDLAGSKLFLKSSTEEEEKYIEKHQNTLESILRHCRVERRCARAQAEWCPEQNLAKVTKVVKGLLYNFGHQNKHGIFMYPEEMLFLVETNRMEVTLQKITLSIQECYDLLLQSVGCNLGRYRVYRKLVLQGYRLVRYMEMLEKKARDIDKESKLSKKQSLASNRNKRKVEEISEKSKKMHTEPSSEVTERERNKKEKLQSLIGNIFENIKKNIPTEIHTGGHVDINPDYCVFLSGNTNRIKYDFNLYISETSVLDKMSPDEKIPSIYAICTNENISFYMISNVHLPFLPI